MTDRAQLLCDRIHDRLHVVCQAVPPIRPEAAYWLDSDAGPSYCHACVRVARGREFELGPLLAEPAWYDRDEWCDAFFDGIDGGFDTTSDSTQYCEICRKTLSYILTDYGVEEEMSYFRENPLVIVRDEDSYALDRLTLNIYSGSSRHTILGVALAVNQAFRLVAQQIPEVQHDRRS